MSLPSVFSRTIGLDTFGESYNVLLGLEIIIDDNVLKWDSQWPKLMQTSVILMIFQRHMAFLTIILICL